MLLEINNLNVSYKTGGRSTQVLHDVSIAVGSGEVVGLVGESGSGKSTMARSAIRLLPDGATMSGQVTINGTDVSGASKNALRAIRAQSVGFIQQDPKSALNPVRTIGASVCERLVHVHGVNRREARDRAVALLAEVGIDQPDRRMGQYPHELSGGMLQRVVLAACLTTRPRLLIADEATSALDVTTQAEVLALLRREQQSRELGMLFVTHDLRLAAAYCNRVYVLLEGRIVEVLEGRDLFTSAREDYTRHLLSCIPPLPSQRGHVEVER
jgi:peptide/nickel transport system ATP-binding protein